MRISAKTIERLIEIITGNTKKSPYRSGPQLIEFFRDFGERDLYGQGFPARAYYVQERRRMLICSPIRRLNIKHTSRSS